jgi:hypothetical protein
VKAVRIWLGLAFLTFGVLGILDAADVLDSGGFVGRWWPVAIIGLGVSAMIAQRRVSTGPVVIAALGLVLLADQLEWTSGSILWPTALVLVGIAVLAGLARNRTADPATARTPVVMFSGATTRERSAHLHRTDVSAVFGGATLDLREAHIDDKATVDAFALFGGVQVLVPKEWRVSLGGLPFMGGFDDKTSGGGDLPPDAPLLTVNATAIFGGVEVANEPKK